MTLDPRRLLVLRAVHRTGSVAAAAAALHLTASGVSQRLARLESEAGLALLDRSRRGGGRSVGLTAAGVALAQRADEVAHALAEAQREAERLRDGATGHVRVGGFATALGYLVVPALGRLAISDPALEIQVFETTAAEGTTMLRAGELDLLLGERYGDVPGVSPRTHPGLVEEGLRRDPFRIVVPALWPAPVRLEELLAGPWVSTAPDLPARHMLDRLSTEHGVALGRWHSCTDAQTVLGLVAAGLGAAIVPGLTLSYLDIEGVTVHRTTTEVGARVVTLTGPAPARAAPPIQRLRTALQEIAAER